MHWDALPLVFIIFGICSTAKAVIVPSVNEHYISRFRIFKKILLVYEYQHFNTE